MLTGRTPWKAKTEKELGRMLNSVPIKKLMPKNISANSMDFLSRTLDIDYQARMCPEELTRFVFNEGYSNTYSSIRRLDKTSERCGSQQKSEVRETSLTRNSINTPKNPKRFNFIRADDTAKNSSLPKTAATIGSSKDHPLSSNNITGLNSTQAQSTMHHTSVSNSVSHTNGIQGVDKKLLSKQLLSQIHFCRFLYKLLKRIEEKINGNVSDGLKDLMSSLIFYKLTTVKELDALDGKTAR
jgi:hypothetical protein